MMGFNLFFPHAATTATATGVIPDPAGETAVALPGVDMDLAPVVQRVSPLSGHHWTRVNDLGWSLWLCDEHVLGHEAESADEDHDSVQSAQAQVGLESSNEAIFLQQLWTRLCVCFSKLSHVTLQASP